MKIGEVSTYFHGLGVHYDICWWRAMLLTYDEGQIMATVDQLSKKSLKTLKTFVEKIKVERTIWKIPASICGM